MCVRKELFSIDVNLDHESSFYFDFILIFSHKYDSKRSNHIKVTLAIAISNYVLVCAQPASFDDCIFIVDVDIYCYNR